MGQDRVGTRMEKSWGENTITFGERVTDFYLNGARPTITATNDVGIMDPFAVPEVRQATIDFYTKFYSDNRNRVLVIGINPGRFGGGLTGIPFTDPWALANPCAIPAPITGQRELSSVFVYDMIERYGGLEAFFGEFLLSAVLPFGLISGKKNLNYYDRRELITELNDYIVRTMWTQIGFGARRDVAIVLGTGKNLRYLNQINTEHRFFERLVPVEHPRFVMQYRLKRKDEFLNRYCEVLRQAVSGSESESGAG